MHDKPVLFVRCGQSSDLERKLGSDICELVRTLLPDIEPYFAQNQSTVDGLSNHILKALYRCAGFICVMHKRGELQTPDERIITRGSVWVEQEVAIVALMRHVLNRSIPVLFYKETGVSIEGIRSVLLMNPQVEFERESQVLDHLRRALPGMRLEPYADYDLVAVPDYTETGVRGDRHEYMFSVNVKNVGRQKVTDFRLRAHFPRAFMNPSTHWGCEVSRSDTHICLEASEKNRLPSVLYSGDTLRNPLTIEYFVDDVLHSSPDAMRSEIKIELCSGSMTPKTMTLRIADYQHF